MRMRTRGGRSVDVTRTAPDGLPAGKGGVVLDVFPGPRAGGRQAVSLTPDEARRLAELMVSQAAAADSGDTTGRPGRVDVTPGEGLALEIRTRGHVLVADQPLEAGGADAAPTPVELFVASIASCAAHYAGSYLDRHGITRDGLSVRAEFHMAEDRPARVRTLALTVAAPHLPPSRLAAMRAVVSHCTVTNTLERLPDLTLDVHCGPDPAPTPAPTPDTGPDVTHPSTPAA
ncbi:OsmC family protein [Streptomyces sp. NPDC002734]|uniref:OsmC family protein n=1 Tax=Streptomyces sp. NPDC002734 TaxID=3154426 RepID=UPI00332FBFD8